MTRAEVIVYSVFSVILVVMFFCFIMAGVLWSGSPPSTTLIPAEQVLEPLAQQRSSERKVCFGGPGVVLMPGGCGFGLRIGPHGADFGLGF